MKKILKIVKKSTAVFMLLAFAVSSFGLSPSQLAQAVDVNVTTNPATTISQTDATLNGTNGGTTSAGSSFWTSLNTFSTASPTLPAGVYSTADFGAVTANTSFSSSLSSSGITVTPNTTYYFAAWSNVGGTWYPGEVLSFTTSPVVLPGTLSAEDFGVVNYDAGGGLGIIKGYTAGFGLADNTFAGATSVVVKLYATGDVLLQTNTAVFPKFNLDITGTQFSSPFDVSGTFNYGTDGYWTNVRETQYGQSSPATKVVATVTLQNGKVVTAENTLPTGDPTTIYPTPPSTECDATVTQTIVSGTDTQYNSGNSTVLVPNAGWTTIPGASWVWGTNGNTDNTTVSTTQTFTKSFNIVGTPTSASIKLSADNGYVLKVNGTTVDSKNVDPTNEFNYQNVETYDITSYVNSGANTLEVKVTNFARSGTTFNENPAGLIYSLTIDSKTCPSSPPETTCDLTDGKDGWYGTYYNYPSTNIGMDLPENEWDNNYGNPLSANNSFSAETDTWTANWYNSQFARFSQVDANLMFGPSWFPFNGSLAEEINNGHDYHFGVHWSAKVTAPSTGNYAYNLSSDDDAWIYVNGILVVDNSDVHPALLSSGNINLTAGINIVDVYFAERKVVESEMSFKFMNTSLDIKAYSDDCVPVTNPENNPGVTTNPATAKTQTNATLNGTNGPNSATESSFWASLNTFSTASPTLPTGVYSTSNLGPVVGNTSFSALLSSTGITVTPNTTYYFAAWSKVGGTWYPGAVLSFTTSPTEGGIGGEVVTGKGVLEVTSIEMTDSTGTANNTYENGWKYVFNITVPTDETDLSMKFANWIRTGGIETIAAGGNMRISSPQANNGGATIPIVTANVYSTPALTMITDLNPLLDGIQVKVTVELKIPTGTTNGSYTTSYGVKSE